MTGDTAREVFCETVVPVILSNSLSAHRLALGLKAKNGLASVLCGKHRGLLDLIDLDCGFLPLSEDMGRLTLEQLIDFSDKWNECILVLIPVTDSHRRFISENCGELESRYLTCNDGDIDKLSLDLFERRV